jgi:hypothetical protein
MQEMLGYMQQQVSCVPVLVQTRSSYTKLVDLLRESADMFPHLFGPEEVPVPTFMVGRRSKLSFALTGEPIGGGGYGSVYGLDLCNGKQVR